MSPQLTDSENAMAGAVCRLSISMLAPFQKQPHRRRENTFKFKLVVATLKFAVSLPRHPLGQRDDKRIVIGCYVSIDRDFNG
jgi:hypothetical protein